MNCFLAIVVEILLSDLNFKGFPLGSPMTLTWARIERLSRRKTLEWVGPSDNKFATIKPVQEDRENPPVFMHDKYDILHCIVPFLILPFLRVPFVLLT